MPDELKNFHTTGMTWKERAENCGDVAAVYDPGSLRRSAWISRINAVSLKKTLNKIKSNDTIVDFGCGIGHLTKKFLKNTKKVLGLDITYSMLKRAKQNTSDCLMLFNQTDGLNIPIKSETVDLIWVCGVLRYSLNVPEPKHRLIVDEFYRVLKPGGYVCNLEMYVEQPENFYSRDFIEKGFIIDSITVPRFYNSIFDKLALSKYKNIFLKDWFAKLSVIFTEYFFKYKKKSDKIRDYFFVYKKPEK